MTIKVNRNTLIVQSPKYPKSLKILKICIVVVQISTKFFTIGYFFLFFEDILNSIIIYFILQILMNVRSVMDYVVEFVLMKIMITGVCVAGELP